MAFKKLLPLIALFLLLGAGALWYVWSSRDGQLSSLREERTFRIEDTDRIGKIFLVHREGEQVLLERKGEDWVYNTTWKARPDAVENLLDAIRRIQVKYQPAQAAVPNIVRNLVAEGIKVEIYDRRGRMMTAYYIGGSTADERGTFAIREGFEQPFVAHLDGWEGNLRFRYSLKGEDWRDRSVFSLDPDRIREVSIAYPAQRNQSFRLRKTEGGYQIDPFYPTTPVAKAPYRIGSAEGFLTGFESIVAEDFRNAYPAKDSILQLLPFAIIEVVDDAGGKQSAKLFPILPIAQEADVKTGQLPAGAEIERYFAATGSGDFMLVQHRVIQKILWGYPFFFEEIR